MPATRVICSPTPVDPVNVIFRTRGSEQSSSPSIDPLPVTHCNASGGNPASIMSSVNFSATSGVALAGFRITALPAASAWASLCSTRGSGKLNGVIATTTPHGTRIARPSLPAPLKAASSGSTSPRSCDPSKAASRSRSGHRPTSPRDSDSGLPSSREIVSANSSTRDRAVRRHG